MGGKPGKASTTLDQKSLQRLQSVVKGELSADEIQTWYKTYKQSRHSGQRELTKEEFKEVYNGVFTGDATDFAEHVFRTFDLNNDGQVDFNEFLLGLCCSGSSDAETKITWAFKVYDIDGDGTITWKEMKNIIQSVSNMTSDSVIEDLEKGLLDDIRQNHAHPDQKCLLLCDVSDSPYETRDRVAELADIIFQELDEDKDGRITLEEFRDGALRLPCIISLLDRNPDL